MNDEERLRDFDKDEVSEGVIDVDGVTCSVIVGSRDFVLEVETLDE